MRGRIIRTALALAAATTLAMTSAAPLLASDDRATITLQPQAAQPGARVQVTGHGFVPYEGVDVFVDGVHADVVTANRDGTVAARVTTADRAVPGRHWVSVRGRRDGVVVQAPVDVRPAATLGWPQPGFDAGRSGAARADPWISPGTMSSIETVWRRPVSGRPPILVGDTMIGVVGGYYEGYEIVASDIWTGDVRWRSEMQSEFGADPASDGDVVLVSDWGRVRALDVDTGATRWTRALPDWVDELTTPPTISDGTAFVAAQRWGGRSKATFFALDAGSGSVRWSTTLPGTTGWSRSAIAVDEGALYTPLSGSRRGGVASFDATTGALRWRRVLRADESPGPITVSNGLVLTHAEPYGNLIAIDADTGALRWRADTVGGAGGNDSITVTQAGAVVGGYWWESSGGELATVDLGTGAVLWRRSLQPAPVGTASAGALLLAMTGEGDLHSIDPGTGETRWRSMVTSSPSGRPVIADGAVYVASWNDTVTTLRRPTPDKPERDALEPDATVALDGDHGLEALTSGWTMLGEGGLGDVRNGDVTSAVSYLDDVYVGTEAASGSTGAEIWRSFGGAPFERVAAFGGARTIELAATATGMYAVAVGDGGIDLYRSDDGVGYSLVVGAPTQGDDATLVHHEDSTLMLVRTDHRVHAYAIDRAGRVVEARVPEAQPRGLRLPADRMAPWSDGVGFRGARYVGLAAPAGGELWRSDDGATFERVEGIEGLVPKGGAPVPQVVAGGRLYVVIESAGGARVSMTDDGRTFEWVPTANDPLPDRDVSGDLAVAGSRVVFATSNRDQRVLDGNVPLEIGRARAFSVLVSTDGGRFDRVRRLPADPHDARSALAGTDGTLLVAVSNFREGDAVWQSGDGIAWEPIFREDGTTPFTTDARIAIVDGYAFLFLTDQHNGVTIWRYDTALAAIGEGGSGAWISLLLVLLIASAVIGAAWFVSRRRQRPRPPTLGPTEPWGPAVPNHERLHL